MERLSEGLAVVAAIPPRVVTTAAQTRYSDVVDMSKFQQVIVIGQARSAGTKQVKGLQVKLWNCDASGTAATTAFKIAAITHVAATAGQEPLVVVCVTSGDLRRAGYGPTLNAPYRYFKASITNSTNVRDSSSMVVLAGNARFGPASDWDNADVKAIETY